MKTPFLKIGVVIVTLAMLYFSLELKVNLEKSLEKKQSVEVHEIPLPFEPRVVRNEITNTKEYRCLSEAIFYEAGTQSQKGKEAVALVILNRTTHNNFPYSVCGVVSQRYRNQNCQFSYFCKRRELPSGDNWQESKEVAFRALNGEFDEIAIDKMKNVLYFHSDKVRPQFHQNRTFVAKIENHLFYR